MTSDREQARAELEAQLRGRRMDDHDAHVAVDWITYPKTRDLVLRALGMEKVGDHGVFPEFLHRRVWVEPPTEPAPPIKEI